MKVYIISNSGEKAERFANAIEKLGASITLREVQSDERKLSEISSNAINSSNADYVLVFAEDPVAANVHINKQKNLTSAVCNSARDLHLAKKNNISVIVVGESFDNADSFAKMLVSTTATKPQAEKPKPIHHPLHHEKQAAKPEREQKDSYEQEYEEYEGEEKEERGPKRPGIIGMLKDSLGIIDK